MTRSRSSSLWSKQHARSGADRSRQLSAPRYQHRYPALVGAVLVAENRNQVTLFKPDADKDVSGGHRREQQMARGHRRRRPECDDEAEIDRVPYESIEQR